ncbi:MAG: 4Fe-4S cluster-binding domain-containing protein [Candidatus Eisenbacteria bacterium]|uniref:4Fe-4S cluster-binding domain-containing protein n=1 Tax=Eiseniibacteriota bacterium TaxID=2212470 RepID=A0A7Y2E7G0_UNCEI|nr:4Fe-4S cluster-binding domain-containing protein [Candidatus Eisenbacteria bacterium]
MARPENVQALFLTLTGSCNLSCSYCFEDDKNSSKMLWDTAKKSLDWALSATNPVEIVFYGGEPLMEFPMIQKAVAYVNERVGPEHQILFGLVTNGLLMRREVLDFLDEHRFSIQLSFDGVPSAQLERGKGTWDILDNLITQLPTTHPKLFSDLTVNITAFPSTIRHLSASVDYFLEKRVIGFGISPVFTDSSSWQVSDIEVLREQFQSIYESSLRHYEEHHCTPFGGFQKADPTSPHAPDGYKMCGVSRGEKPTIDTDGRVHACATFTDSIQTRPEGILKDSLDQVDLGSLHDEGFRSNFESLEEKFEGIEIFDGKESKYSSYAKCNNCQYLSRCSVCPVSIGHIPGNTDPNRIPDFFCAFNLVIHAYGDQFRDAISPRRAFGWKPASESPGLRAIAASSSLRRK